MTPTPEQSAIIDFARTRSESLLISALAGAAKTTTLELICKKITSIPILSLAFNKRIAEEMTKRLPSHVQVYTLNSLGHRTWAAYTGKRLVIDQKKTYNILRAEIDELPKRSQQAAYADFGDILKAIGTAKTSGYIPPLSWLEADHSCADFFDLDPELDRWRSLINTTLNTSITAAYAGSIDFNDQIYMSTLFGGIYPKFPLVLVDEAQDLSPLNHAMLRKLVTRRVIAVGDPFQSIYGFRGAVSNGMDSLQSQFSMQTLPLNISFRCPRAIVERARTRAPSMAYPEWAAEGEVKTLPSWGSADIPDGAAIICRNNAPLLSLGLRLIRDRRRITIPGKDIGSGLVKVLKKFGPPELGSSTVLALIDDWVAEGMARPKGKASLHDRADCLRVFASAAPTLGGAIAYAEDLFKQEGPIQLLSGHKAKGLEWSTVFHLDSFRIPSEWAEDLEQELNLDYVITTRTKDKLIYVNLEDYHG